jgi:hypothetical protein
MTGKDEKARRKEILYSQREEKRRLVREGLPVSAPMMKALFDYIDEHLSSAECAHSLPHASEFIHTNRLPKEAIIAWLVKAGGYCDCEAIINAQELLEDAVPGYQDLLPPDGVPG